MKNPVKTKLRIRFVVFSMAALLLLIGTIVSVSIVHSYRELVEKSDVILSQIRDNPDVNVRYFSVKVHPGKGAIRLETVRHVPIDPTQAAAHTRVALNSGKEKGFSGEYRYHIYKNSSGIRVLFLSRASSLDMHRSAATTLIAISAAGLGITCLLLILISGWVVNPLIESQRKQKQFITSAGHALKTPLAVIRADAQLLQTEIGDNIWINGIMEQVDHLTSMTKDLILLSKMEEYHDPVKAEAVCFAELTKKCIDSYKGLLDSKDITFTAQVPSALIYKGSRRELHQLLTILLDNAAKYCPEGGSIQLHCKKDMAGIRLQMRNTAQLDDATDLSQRFVRGSNAVNAEGFGLGLSIAQAIAARHKGNLTVSLQKDGLFLAEVTLR